MNPKYKHLFLPLCLILLVIIGILTYVAVRVYDHYYGMLLVDEKDSAPAVIAKEEYNLIYGGEYRGKAIRIDEQLYLDMDVINEEWAGGLLFYADDVNQVFYTTQLERSEYEIGQEDFQEKDGVIYIRAKTAESMFGTRSYVNEKEGVVMVREPFGQEGEVLKSKTYLRLEPSLEERQYTTILHRGDAVEIFDCDTKGFYYAVSTDGYRGYIEADRVDVEETTMSRKEPSKHQTDSDLLFGKPISIAFQQLYTTEVTEEIEDDVWNASWYLDVIIPTWFSLNERGSIDSVASHDYVDLVHGYGIEIYALFSNSFNDELTMETLSSTAKRAALCNQLLTYCQTYGIEGINVDFEAISEETNRYYVQFLRELSIVLRLNDYVLSVDCSVPSEWSSFYRRDVMNDVSDYVIVMAYDEHYGGDTTAGSTSSQNFTVNAIVNCLQEGVEKDKLVVAIPWYTRIWETDADGDLSSSAVGMSRAWNFVYDYDLDVEVDDKTGQNYAEGWVDGSLYQIWLEDDVSQAWRLKLVVDSDLAGVAGWSLGLQNYDAWSCYERILFQ